MQKRNTKRDFFTVLGFCLVMVLALSNGFLMRIYAQEQQVEIYREIEPIGDVIDIILREYVRDVDMGEIVEGALSGMVGSLDRNSAYVSAEELEALREETKGEFEGIGVSIKQDDNGNIMVFMPIVGSPAALAGIKPYDLIVAIDGKSTEEVAPSLPVEFGKSTGERGINEVHDGIGIDVEAHRIVGYKGSAVRKVEGAEPRRVRDASTVETALWT